MQASSTFHFLQDDRLFQSPETIEAQEAHKRIIPLFLTLGLLFFLVLGKLTNLMVIHTSARDQHAHRFPATLIERGNILDRNGHILATSLITSSIYANPKKILNPQEAAHKLSSLFTNLSYDSLYKKLSSSKSFVWIKRTITPHEQQEVNKLGIPGVYFQREEKRVYPHHKLTAHVVGLTSIDNTGISGIEKSFDETLRENNSSVNLSLDIRVQHILHDALSKGMETFQAKAASGIVLDTETSEVIAMVSLPDFDPNYPKKIDPNTTFNTSTLGIYEMGSIFKIFTLAMALDSGKITLKDGYDTSKTFKVGRHRIKDFHSKNRWLSIPEIFMYSSNIGSVKMVMDMGIERQKDFLEKLGFFQPLSFELPETGTPLTPRSWGEVTAATASYGYGLAISPLQMINGVASIINGGLLRTPTLILGKNKGAPEKRIIASSTSDTMRRLLHLSVKEGTGRKGDAKGYLVGGKTGTANKNDGGKYTQKNYHRSLFAGAFPMLKPRYVVLVMLDEPQGTKETFGFSTGGWTSAPIAGEVIKHAAPLLNVLPVDENSPTIRSAMHLTKKASQRVIH